VVGSKRIEPLFRDYVLTDKDASLLTERASAREALDGLAQSGNGWAPPVAVHDAMGRWQFDRAQRLIGIAEDLRIRADGLTDTFAALDINVADHLQARYESAASLAQLEEELDDFEEVATTASDLRNELDAVDPVASVGLIGTDLGLDEADAALAEGDLDAGQDALADAISTVNAADERGRRFLLMGGALLLVVAAIVVFSLLRARRRRPAPPDRVIDLTQLEAQSAAEQREDVSS
jgi:hypothetical protein